MIYTDYSFYNWWSRIYRAEPDEKIGLTHWVEFQKYNKEKESILKVKEC